MTDRTYRVTEIVGTSREGVKEAITNGISRAGPRIWKAGSFATRG